MFPTMLYGRNFSDRKHLITLSWLIRKKDLLNTVSSQDIMKTCIKFLITSTSIIAKTIVKIVERLKSYLHFQLKSFFLHASIIKKKSPTFSSTYFLSRILHRIQLPSHSRSIQHSLFEIVAVVCDLLMQHKTYAKIPSLILSTLSFSFFFLIPSRKHIVYFYKCIYKASVSYHQC